MDKDYNQMQGVMKNGVKLMLGVTFAAIAVVAVPRNSKTDETSSTNRCYGPHEVDLLMRSNHWTEQEARNVLDLVCQYSDRKSNHTN